MKITGTKSYIEVEINGKVIKINGELTTAPAFYADISSIKNWYAPHDKIEIMEKEKDVLIKKIIEESNKEGNIPIIFE